MFNIHIEFERWKLNKEYGLYVSTLGRIKDKKKKIIEPMINPNGYFVIKVNDKIISIHTLVMLTFRGKKEEGMTIDHINSNRRDNRLKNLEYVTKDVNQERALNKLTKEDENVKDPNVLLDMLSSHKIYSIKQLKDILSKKVVAEMVKNNSYKKRIVAKDSGAWVKKYLQTHHSGSVADNKTFAYRVELYAKMNKEYCGYKLSMQNNEIVGIRVC